ncbi:MAG: hypothetical protein RLZZ597_229 [Cyanobacteriota bacterium]|jgi:hypothetical protein
MSPIARPTRSTPSPAAHNALHNREEFTLWAEAVRQQMMDALQKRQKS